MLDPTQMGVGLCTQGRLLAWRLKYYMRVEVIDSNTLAYYAIEVTKVVKKVL